MYITILKKQHIVDQCTRLNLSVQTIVQTMINVDVKHGHVLTDHSEWAVKYVHNNVCVGYAIGDGRVWRTMLSAGMQLKPNVYVYTVRI